MSSTTRVPAGTRPESDDPVGRVTLPAVLLVDDQAGRLLSYEAILANVGVNCVRAMSGEEALKQLLKREFAVIVLDVSMPGMDGFETARLIREHPRLERTPIIFVTGVHISELDRLTGYEVGAIDYISVPVVPEILRSKVVLLVELYNRRTELTSLNRELEAARARLEVERNRAIADRSDLLKEREEHYRAIFEHPTELVVVLEAIRTESGQIVDWRYRDANTNALKLLQRSREELIGQHLRDVLPGRAANLVPLLTQTLQQRASHRYETRVGETDFLICLFPIGENTVVSSGVDITTRKRAELDAQRQSAEARAENEWLGAVLNSMNEEVYFTDTQGRYLYANPAAMREFGHASVEGIGVEQIVAKLEVFRADGTPRPIEEAPPLRSLRGEVIRGEEQIVRIPRTGELRNRQVSSAPVRSAAGEIIGAVSVVRDITDQKRIEAQLRTREARSAALVALGDRFRNATSPTDLAYAAAQLLGETLEVSRCGYGTIDPIAETITIERDWNAPGSNSIAGLLHFREYGTYIEQLKHGDTVVCHDTETDPRTQRTAGALQSLGVRSFINMPIVEKEGTVALLYLTHTSPRVWTPDELAFVREVAERTRVTVERRRSEQAAMADLRDTRILRDLAARVVAEGTLEALFDDIVAAAMTIAEADAGTIQMLDESTQQLRLAATSGFADTLAAHFLIVDRNSNSSCGISLASGQRAIVYYDANDAATTVGAQALLAADGFKCAQSTPLVSRSGRMLGMFSTHWRSSKVLAERELRFFDLLARQAADLIERIRDEQALRKSEQELRDSARRKDEFLAVLAHELRNPLAALSAAAHLLGKSDKAEAAALARDALQRQIVHMARLLDDLLDVARITHGRLQLRTECVDVIQLLRSLADGMRSQLAAKHQELTLDADTGPIYVQADPVRLSQIVGNLLSNSSKYTAPGGQIALQACIEHRSAVIRVRDNGIGIASDILPRIFEMFAQGPHPPGGATGLGIGLSLAKGLVELHGGSIEARSAGEGRGSEFVVSLPALVPADDPRPIATTADQPTAAKSLRILVADDNADNALSLSMLLEGQGYSVRTAFDGKSALDEAERFHPQVVLLDIGMPQLSGYEVAARIRRSDWGQSAVLIAMTGWGQARDKEDAKAAGFDRHLTKPASFEDIDAVLKRLAG